MYFEIFDHDDLIIRGRDIIGGIEWDHELMSVPSVNITLPVYYLGYIDGREEIKLHVNGKTFWGIIKDIDVNKPEETIALTIDHAVSEWEYRQISVNRAIQSSDLNIVYKGAKTIRNKGEAITASDFTLTQKAYDAATDEQLIAAAYARAWDTANGDRIAITHVDERLESKDVTSADEVPVKTKGQAIVDYAKRFIGTPYVWGGNSLTKGCDCSGFTKKVFEHFGINIARYSGDQIRYGVPVSRADIQPGDLIVYHGHVAIVVDSNHIIHATKNSRMNGVQIRSNPWYRSVAGIRRLVGTKDDKGSARQYSDAGYGSKYLNGKEADAIFTAYYPKQSDLYDAHGKKLEAKNQTCAAPKDLDGKQIQISELIPDRTTYKNRIYTVNDNSSSTVVDDDGVYHISLLVSNKRTADSFGKRKGKIIIGNGTYSYKGNTASSSSSSSTYDVTFSTDKGTAVTVKMTIGDDYETSSAQDASVADNIGDIFSDMNFAYPGWGIDFQDDSSGRMIDYVYSKQNKLEALTKTMELTDDLFWRVGFTNEKRIEIGRFGERKPYIISVKPPGRSNISIIEEPTIDYDFGNVVNVATVYSEKSDTGMSSMTLREVYNDPSLQIDGFPVVILRANVNNERDYKKYTTQYPKLAPNNELEYAVLDEESIALEAGYLIEGSYAFTDLAPFSTESKIVTDAQRKRQAQRAYKATIRKLKQARRSYTMSMTVTELPAGINVGDKVRLLYDNKIWNLDACSNYWKKVLSMDDWFYVQKISYRIGTDGAETDEIVLSKYIKVDRESDNQ